MGISTEVQTKLSFADYAAIMQLNPIHAHGVNLNGGTGPDIQRVACDSAWPQSNWQASDRVSRDEVMLAIARAEADIEAAIGYRLLPDWEVDEWRPTYRPYRPELAHLSTVNLRGYQQSIPLGWGHFVSGGVKATTLIDDDAAIVWSDADSDGYFETGTVSVTVQTSDPCEIRAFYPGHSADPRYEIRPITVTIVGNTATITFRRELAVIEDELFGLVWNAVDGLDDDMFLTAVDVYRVWNDPQTQATIMWEGGGCGSCAACQFGTQSACLHARGDPQYGQVAYAPATWDAEDEVFEFASLAVCRNPDIVRTWYYAGLRDMRSTFPETVMDRDWARTVAYYATSMLERPLCDCTADVYDYWRTDISVVGGRDAALAYTSSVGDMDNPFGTRRGAHYAWRRVKGRPNAIINRGVVV